MARGRQQAEWSRTSLLAAIVRNSYHFGKRKPFEPWEFDPFANGKPPFAEKPKLKIKVDCLKVLCEPGIREQIVKPKTQKN